MANRNRTTGGRSRPLVPVTARRVTIDQASLIRAYYLTKTSPTIVMIREFIMRYMTTSGADVYFKVGNKKHEMTPAYKQFFDSEWLDNYLTEQELNFDAIGFAVVRFVPSSTVDGELVPCCLEPHQYHATFYYDERGVRQWQIYNTIPQTKSRSSKGGVNPPISVGEPMDDVLVFERHRPLFNGELTSPVAIVAERIMSIEEKFQNQGYADYWRTHLPWCTRTVPSRSAPDPLENDTFAEDDVADATAQHAVRLQRDRLDLMEMAKKHAESSSATRSAASISPVYDTASRFGANPHSVNPPYLHNFPLPDGLDIAQAPRPEPLQNIIETVEQQLSDIYNVFGVPPSIGIQTRASFEAHVKNARRQLNMSIAQRQRKSEPILAKLYNILYRNSHREFIEERIAKKEEKLKKQRTPDEIEPGEPVEDVELSLFEKKSIRTFVESEATITVAFRHMPDTDLADLDYLWSKRFISYETAAAAAISIVGLGADKQLTEEEHEEEIEKMHDEEAAAAEAAAGPQPKPKAKPAAKKRKPGEA